MNILNTPLSSFACAIQKLVLTKQAKYMAYHDQKQGVIFFRSTGITKSPSPIKRKKRVYGQFSIETIHERRKRKREFVLLIQIGK